ncbi:MAG: TolC family protein [Endomicrobia bacterium]|nr:TolC family protein [Endomicrobiia bacterium]MCL2507294.1 TolC family protein [Endomicrobiia bacterium]
MKKMYTKSIGIFVSALFLMTVFPSFSQARFDDPFLQQLVKIAEARDQKLVVAYEQIQLAEIRAIKAARAFFPQIMLQHSSSKGTTAMAASAGGFAADEYNSQEYGVRAVQTLYEGYRTKGMYRYETMMVDAARFNYTKTREELLTRVKLAYFEYLTLNQEYKALGKAFEIVETLIIKIRNEYKARAISELDMVEAENFRDKVADMLASSQINLGFTIKKLLDTVGIHSLDDINAKASEELSDDIAEITFTLHDILSFVLSNNLDVQTAKVQAQMADMRIRINRSKIIPKFYVEGFYGKSGEAFTTEPLELTTAWNVALRMSWGLWGNSLEASYNQEHTDPSTIVDASKRIDTTSYDIKLSLLDDLGFFVDAKESRVGFNQTSSEYVDVLKTRRLEVEKAYNEYLTSLNSARTSRKEITLRERKLALMRRKNELYEVPTVNLMEESWKYAEAISAYARAIFQNHSSVTEMERLTLMPLR